MSRLAQQYGISDNGLAKFAAARTFRTRRVAIGQNTRPAGKVVESTPLPESDRPSRSITIYPTALPEPPKS